MLALGGLAGLAGWPAAIAAGAGGARALALLLLAYRPHPNDRAGPAAARRWRSPGGRGAGCIAGASEHSSSAPCPSCSLRASYLGAAGLGAAEIGLLTGAATWLVVASAQAGGCWRSAGADRGAADHRRARWRLCLLALATRTGPPPWR